MASAMRWAIAENSCSSSSSCFTTLAQWCRPNSHALPIFGRSAINNCDLTEKSPVMSGGTGWSVSGANWIGPLALSDSRHNADVSLSIGISTPCANSPGHSGRVRSVDIFHDGASESHGYRNQARSAWKTSSVISRTPLRTSCRLSLFRLIFVILSSKSNCRRRCSISRGIRSGVVIQWNTFTIRKTITARMKYRRTSMFRLRNILN